MIYPMYPIYKPFYFNIPDTNFFRPPQLFDLLNSMVNFEREEQVKISDLPRVASSMVFDFEYPLSTKVNKQDFETMILKKFFNRRIGYETYTSWKMALDVKLNEIMPTYNKLFDALANWDLFKDGENYTRTIDRAGENKTDSSSETNANIDNSADNIRKFSNLPQNELQNIEDSNYMTDYTHETNTGKSTTKGTATGNEKTNTTENTKEIFEKDASNKIDIYNSFLQNRANIMSLIFKDLDSLFYGLANFN